MTKPSHPPGQMPPLTALRAFEAVGRTGSVRSAGEELSVNHSVVSRHIRNLEQWLGVKLVETRGRGIALTRLGARYHDEIAGAFHVITRATAELAPRTRRTLEIWCTPGLANQKLLSALPELEASLPAYDLIFRPTLARPALTGGEPDAEIVYLTRPERRTGAHFELLVEPRVFPVASPDLLAHYPPVEVIDDIVALPLVHERSTHQWTVWLQQNNMKSPPLLSGVCLWHAHLSIEAARLGQGVALANELLVEEDLASGRLVELLDTNSRLGGYHLIVAERRWRDHSIVALHQWLRSTFALVD